MFEKGLHIGVGLGLVFLSPVILIFVALLESLEYNESYYDLSILVFFLVAFIINGIGLILRKKWALIAFTVIVLIASLLTTLGFYLNAEQAEFSDYDIATIVLIIIFGFGAIFILNSNTVKKEFKQEIVHNELDDILDA